MKFQFLDGSAVRYKTSVQRDPRGQLCFAREFRFEFTTDGHNRYPGYIRLLGNRLQLLDLEYPDLDPQVTPEPSSQKSYNHLLLSASYSEDSDALRKRIEERPDCRN